MHFSESIQTTFSCHIITVEMVVTPGVFCTLPAKCELCSKRINIHINEQIFHVDFTNVIYISYGNGGVS